MSIFTTIAGLFSKPTHCQDVDKFLVDYLEGTLDEKTSRKFEEHINLCPACKVFLDQYKETIQLTRACDNIEIPKELVDRTLQFLNSELRFKS